MQPDIPTVRHIHICARGFDYQYGFDNTRNIASGVARLLQGHGLIAPQAFIGRNDEGTVAIRNPPGQGLRTKTTKHNRMHGTDARAGQHGHRRLWHHRHI